MSCEGVGLEQKVRNGGKGWGGKEKPAAEPIHFTERRSSTNGRQLGITIGQSHVNQAVNVNNLSIDGSRVDQFQRSGQALDQVWPFRICSSGNC